MMLTDLLSYCQGNIIPLQPAEKLPLQTSWTISDSPIQTPEDARGYLDLGYNIGYRIPGDHLILDIDPRTFFVRHFKDMAMFFSFILILFGYRHPMAKGHIAKLRLVVGRKLSIAVRKPLDLFCKSNNLCRIC